METFLKFKLDCCEVYNPSHNVIKISDTKSSSNSIMKVKELKQIVEHNKDKILIYNPARGVFRIGNGSIDDFCFTIDKTSTIEIVFNGNQFAFKYFDKHTKENIEWNDTN